MVNSLTPHAQFMIAVRRKIVEVAHSQFIAELHRKPLKNHPCSSLTGSLMFLL